MSPTAAIVPEPYGALTGGRLLTVGVERSLLSALEAVGAERGWEIQSVADGALGLQVIQSLEPAVVLTGARSAGLELSERIRALAPRTQHVLIAGKREAEGLMAKGSPHDGSVHVLVRPVGGLQLALAVQGAFERLHLQMDRARLEALARRQGDELIEARAELETQVELRTRRLNSARHEWEMIFEALYIPLAVVRGTDFTVQRANLAYARAAGRSIQDLAQRPLCHEFLFGRPDPCPACPLKQSLSECAEGKAEISHKEKTYALSVFPMPQPDSAVCSYRDVTEERAMNRQLLDSEKMAAVGRLAGGVAHEINNPLGGILAFSQLMQRDAGRTPADLESLSLIEESALRCKRIVESLLRFSRQSRSEDRRAFDLSSCVEDAAILFRAQLKSAPRARLEQDLVIGLPEVFGDPARLGQVVLNLLQNGLQALPKAEGTLSIQTGLANGRCFFRVKDTGVGISKENLPHIFEPHFTTKPPGENTGVGLAIAYRIVEDHRGSFQVDTEPGKGSTFTVFLPVPPLPPPPTSPKESLP